MKKLIFYFSLILLIINCNSNSGEDLNARTSIKDIKANFKIQQTQNAINYQVRDENLIFKISSDIKGTEYDSYIEVFSIDNDKLLELSYSFDTSESHWKIKQKESVIHLANELENKNLPLWLLEDMSFFYMTQFPRCTIT